MFKVLRKLFVTGIVFWVPVLVTYWVVTVLYGLLMKTLKFEPLRSLTIGMDVQLAGLFAFLFILGAIAATGLLVRNFFGRHLVLWFEYSLKRVPLISAIYSTVKQSLEMIFDEKSTSFREVVIVRFPSYESWSIGFVTKKDQVNGLLTVFVPTTPNPTSGYILFVREDDALSVDLTVDEALKFVISLGTVSSVDAAAILNKTKRESS